MTTDEFRAALTALGMTQVALAKKLGLDPRTVRRWALGECPVPQAAAMLLRLWLDAEKAKAPGAGPGA